MRRSSGSFWADPGSGTDSWGPQGWWRHLWCGQVCVWVRPSLPRSAKSDRGGKKGAAGQQKGAGGQKRWQVGKKRGSWAKKWSAGRKGDRRAKKGQPAGQMSPNGGFGVVGDGPHNLGRGREGRTIFQLKFFTKMGRGRCGRDGRTFYGAAEAAAQFMARQRRAAQCMGQPPPKSAARTFYRGPGHLIAGWGILSSAEKIIAPSRIFRRPNALAAGPGFPSDRGRDGPHPKTDLAAHTSGAHLTHGKNGPPKMQENDQKWPKKAQNDPK